MIWALCFLVVVLFHYGHPMAAGWLIFLILMLVAF